MSEVTKNISEISGLTVLKHEIVQHLHNVNNMNQLLAMYAKTDKTQNITDQIRLQSFNALRKFNDFADYVTSSKCYDAFTQVSLHKVEIITTVRKIHERLLKLVTAECNVNISFKSGVDSIFVATDVRRLEKILCNFVSNSVRNMPNPGVRKIRWSVKDSVDSVIISIKDLSGGLTEDDELVIAEAYKTTDYSAICTMSGFELGLAVSLKHAREISAKLSIKNTPGVSVEFSISLPKNLEATEDKPALGDRDYANKLDNSDVFFGSWETEDFVI